MTEPTPRQRRTAGSILELIEKRLVQAHMALSEAEADVTCCRERIDTILAILKDADKKNGGESE